MKVLISDNLSPKGVDILKKAGLEPDLGRELLEMYTSGKRRMEGLSVTHPLRDGDRIIDDYLSQGSSAA